MTDDAVHLLDVNVLVALAWPNHVLHGVAQRWFARLDGKPWATTTGTESSFVRVSLNPQVAADQAVSWSSALDMLASMRSTAGHQWWPDDVDLLASTLARRAPVVGHRQVPDVHLAALAASRGGRLATLDEAITHALHPEDRSVVVVIRRRQAGAGDAQVAAAPGDAPAVEQGQ